MDYAYFFVNRSKLVRALFTKQYFCVVFYSVNSFQGLCKSLTSREICTLTTHGGILCKSMISITENKHDENTMSTREKYLKMWNTYCSWGGSCCVSHWMARVFHWIANQVSTSSAADELPSSDTHLNASSAHHTMRRDHGCHLCRTSLCIKVIPPSVLAVHLSFCIRICCCSS